MCGIAGIFDPSKRQAVDAAVLDRMTDRLAHRGPDDRGTWIEGPVGLGHRRLSIIDLSAAGHQPLFNAEGTVAIVFNGEIYNFQELMAELRSRGYSFRSRSDTEVIVHAWSEWGEACVERLRGMFAFAIWDRERQTLFLARDRVGIKPLYYAVLPDGRLLFGSELKALKVHPDLPREICPRAVADYFGYGYIPEPRTIYRHASKLSPGHTLTIAAGAPVPAPRQYWDMTFTATPSPGLDERAEALRGELADAVASHMVADVPVGAFLSGGVDSSGVVALMAGQASEPVHTTCISFGEAAYDESDYAERIARRYSTNHHVRRVAPDDFGLIDHLAGLYDEPYADSSALPTYRVCQLAREHTKVVLSGDGGDETFAGYRRYRFHRFEEAIRRPLPLGLRRAIFGPLGRWYPKLYRAPRFLRGKATLQGLARDTIEGYFEEVSVCSEAMCEALFSPAMHRELAGYRPVEVLRRHDASAPEETLARAQYLDFKTYLPGDILTKVDRASMAHSLEVRVPILDHRFLEWAGTVTAPERLHRGQGKRVLKRALEPLVDPDILYRRKKGFAVPLEHWFRGPLAERVQGDLLAGSLADTGWFDMDNVASLIREHAAGDRDHSAPLWSLLMFEYFLRREADEQSAAKVPVAGRRGAFA